MKLVKIFKLLSLIFLLMGLLLFFKPAYFYAKSYFVKFILSGNWEHYKNKGFINNNLFDVIPSGKIIIPEIGLENIVLEGASQSTLAYGLGLFDNDVAIHQSRYNVVISGHRDTHFNKLKNIKIGQSIVLEHVEGKSEYVVNDIFLVDPTEISFLDKNNLNTLTLITCYPFNYIGDAPLRMIVIGKLIL